MTTLTDTQALQIADALSFGALMKLEDGTYADKNCAFTIAMAALNDAIAAHEAKQTAEPVAWLPMATAPKDASMLCLLVEFDDGSFEDSDDPSWTIGTNHFDNTGIDEWLFAGWNWSHDCFTQGSGTPIGWLPFHAHPAPKRDPLSESAVLTLYQKYGTGRLDGFTAAIREVEHGITKDTP